MKRRFNVAVVGATGAVGRRMLRVLERRRFPVEELTPLASERSAGKKMHFMGNDVTVQPLQPDSFYGVDIALFSAGGSVSREFAPIAAESGAVVVDNTSEFRMAEDVPLVVPEVNPERIADYAKRNIIANPNCSTIQLVVALKPLHVRFGIERVVVSTYQATSGAGWQGESEMWGQTKAIVNQEETVPEPGKFAHQIAFNCLPHIDVFLDNGYTREEMKVVYETRKILEDDRIRLTCTAVRVPVASAHSESVNVELKRPFKIEEIRAVFAETPGVQVHDDPAKNLYPMAIQAAGTDPVYVGRIRRDESVDNGLNFWCVADNLRKGAALNAVQIAEILTKHYLSET